MIHYSTKIYVHRYVEIFQGKQSKTSQPDYLIEHDTLKYLTTQAPLIHTVSATPTPMCQPFTKILSKIPQSSKVMLMRGTLARENPFWGSVEKFGFPSRSNKHQGSMKIYKFWIKDLPDD